MVGKPTKPRNSPQHANVRLPKMGDSFRSFLGSRDFLIFSVSRSSLTSNSQDVKAPKEHAQVDPRRRQSRCWTTGCRIISIPKRRLRPPRYHQKDVSIPKKMHPAKIPLQIPPGIPLKIRNRVWPWRCFQLWVRKWALSSSSSGDFPSK